MDEILERIIVIKQRKRLTAEMISAVTAISIGKINSYFSGRIKLSLEFIQKFCKYFYVNPNYILFGEEPVYKEEKNTFTKQNNDYTKEFYNFGSRLAKFRVSADMLSHELAQILKISESRLEELILNKKKPTVEEIIILCENFNVTADWLLFGKD